VPCKSVNAHYTERLRNMVYRIVIISVVFFLIGCFYSFKGSLPGHIKSIAIPLFDDRTAYPNIREDLTNLVVDKFVEDNSLKVTDIADADIIISGTIVSISQRAAVLKPGETVEDYNIYVNVKVTCEDMRSNKKLWDKTIQQYGTMSASGQQEERDQAVSDALESIAEDIVNNTIGYW
jgi:hypothetical protein